MSRLILLAALARSDSAGSLFLPACGTLAAVVLFMFGLVGRVLVRAVDLT